MEPFALCTRGSVHLRVTDKTDKDEVSARKEERKKRMHDEIGLIAQGVPAHLTPATLPAKLSRTSQSLLRFLASTQS